jgi:hypothetical protein
MVKQFRILVLSLTLLIMAFQEAESRVVPESRNPGSSGLRQDSVTNNAWIRIDTFDLEIIPPSSGVKFYRDGILYLSSSKQSANLLSRHSSFGKEETRYARIINGTITDQTLFSPNIAFSFPSDAVTFSSDSRTMYYTKYSARDGMEKIYRARFTGDFDNNGEWIYDDDPLNICDDNSACTHPALSADGKLMVFASDREGSVGGMDLYASVYEDGEWAEPVNLGDAVNSSANEMYPYLDSNNNLYFSSDGIQGYGGYDIYICKFKGNTWEKPVNLSKPINTRYDDVAFAVDRSNCKTAFYTVKQNMGKRGQRLLHVTMSNLVPDTLLTLSQYFTSPDISQMIILALEPPVQATDESTESERLEAIEEAAGDNGVTYRIQFLTSFNPGTRSKINVGDKEYDVFEYLYSGAYRLFVGEFKALNRAVDLQNLLRRNNYPGASVIPFVNGVLSTDPELLTEKRVSSSQPAEKVKTEPEIKRVTDTIATDKPTVRLRETVTAGQIRGQSESALQAEEKPKELEERIVYRIQFLSSTTSRGSFNVTISGRDYATWEYFYAGAWRSTVGEFRTVAEASQFQNLVRQAGYNQAFIAAFENGQRIVYH